MLTRPARDVEPEAVIEAVETGMKQTGYSDFSLLSLSCSDYLALPAVGVELRNRLADQNVTLQLPSQRVDRFDDDIAHILGGTRQSGLTFAPEAGTQRLRDIVNKGLTDDDLLKGIRVAMQNGYRKVKLYFMIGLPGETDADVLGIVETCAMLQQSCRDLGRLNLNITISNFTPKPHTPFQWHSVSTAEFQRRQELLRGAFKRLRGLKVNFTDVRLSAMEDFVGRGDRRLAPVIEAAWRAGAGMDAWFESLDRTHAAWTGAISEAGLEGRYREMEVGSWSAVNALDPKDLEVFCRQPLPWDHIDTGIDKTWLMEDLQRALAASVVPDCSFHGCSSCGVCGPELGHNVVVQAPVVPPQVPTQAPPSERVCRLRIQFSKTGSMALLSHLDLMRMLERALRRSGLPISFTGGFHPLPRVQIALALPLGAEAGSEWMDMEFTEALDPGQLQQGLQPLLPPGITLLSVGEVPVSGPSLSQEIRAAVWSFDLELESGLTIDWSPAISALLAADQLMWHDTDKKGRPRSRDCRSVLRRLDVVSENESPRLRLRLEADVDAMGRSLRPSQIQHWLEEQISAPIALQCLKRDRLELAQC
jgi:radical SAM-linked protein